jgi:hypothetical protein
VSIADIVRDGQMQKTGLGTSWDRRGGSFPVLLRARQSELPDGFAYEEFGAPGIGVVRVNDQTLAQDVKAAVSVRAWERIIAAMQLRRAHNEHDNLWARQAIKKLWGLTVRGVRGPSAAISRAFGKLEGSQALSAESLSTLKQSLRSIDPVDPLSSQINYAESAQFTIAPEFTRRMKSVRLILWWNLRNSIREAEMPERLEAGILCPDQTAALFVRAALGDLRACPCCDNPFLPDRPDQQYCTTACRERFRKRRLRANVKKKEAAHGAVSSR